MSAGVQVGAVPRSRAWLLAARPNTLPAAVAPVLVGTAAATPLGEVRWLPFLAALLGALLLQVGANFANDVFDFHKGADTTERLGPLRVTQGGLIPPGQVLVATYLTFGLAAVVGLYLIWVGGLPILVIGVLSILAGLAYTGGPWPLGYHGLGDVFVFVFFGLVAVIGSGYVQTLAVAPRTVLAAIPVGLLVTSILVVNNLRDVATDRVAGKHTLAVRLGVPATRVQYTAFVTVAYLAPLAMAAGGLLNPWFCWLPWLSAPLALRMIRLVRTAEGRPLNAALKGTGQVELLFSLLFAASLWL